MENDLTKTPVHKMVIKMALPMVWGILSIIGFNLIDTFYLGNYGKLELAAISFTFPVVAFFASIALGIGTATTSLVSRAIGEKNFEQAKRLTSDSLSFAVITVVICVVIGFLTVKPLFQFLGAEGKILELVEEYMLIWYSGMIFITVPMVGNGAIRAMGDTRTAAKIMIVAALTNAILDPIFIFGLLGVPAMGIKGAALATVMARAVTLFAALYVLKFKFKVLSFKRPSFKLAIASWKQLIWIGIPAAGTNIITPVVASMTTAVVAKMGAFHVAALGIVTKVESFALIIIFALSSAIGPIIGQNFGAQKGDRIRKAFNFAGALSIGWGVVISGLFYYVGDYITGVFNTSEDIIAAASSYYWFVPISLGLFGVRVMGCSLFNATGKPLHSTFLILLHLFGYYLPLMLVGAHLLQMEGVYLAMSIANILSGLTTLYIIQRYLEKIEHQGYYAS